ncbi:hypothetical protein [Pediococcus pentosaceus]|nr:hypothetical protein [Pediococcus pentosaceus]
MDADNTYLVLFGYQLLVVTMPKHRFTTRAVNGRPRHSSPARLPKALCDITGSY